VKTGSIHAIKVVGVVGGRLTFKTEELLKPKNNNVSYLLNASMKSTGKI